MQKVTSRHAIYQFRYKCTITTAHGAVDESDQMIHHHNVLRSTHKYWKTLFFHFIDKAIVNSYIIHVDTEKNPLSVILVFVKI